MTMLVIVTLWTGIAVIMVLPSRNETGSGSWLERSLALVLVALLYGGWILSRIFWPEHEITVAVVVMILISLVPITQRFFSALLEWYRGE